MKSLNDLPNHQEEWYKIATYFGCPNHLLQDVVQDVYIKLHHIQEKNGEIRNFKAYVFKAIQSTVTDYHRKQKKMQQTFLNEATTTDQSCTKNPDEVERQYQVLITMVDFAIRNLEDHDRQLIELYFIGNMSIRKIAKHTGVPYYVIFNLLKNVKTKIKAKSQTFYKDYCEAKKDYHQA